MDSYVGQQWSDSAFCPAINISLSHIPPIQKLYLNTSQFYVLPNITPFHLSHCFLGQMFFPEDNTGQLCPHQIKTCPALPYFAPPAMDKSLTITQIYNVEHYCCCYYHPKTNLSGSVTQYALNLQTMKNMCSFLQGECKLIKCNRLNGTKTY